MVTVLDADTHGGGALIVYVYKPGTSVLTLKSFPCGVPSGAVHEPFAPGDPPNAPINP